MNSIEVTGLRKSFGGLAAVDGLSFYVEKGDLFAFLGPNGAGKSTTISMLCTLLQPDEGEAVINGCRLGKDDAGIRNSIGVVYQDSLLDSLLTVEENLEVRASFYGLTGEKRRQAVKRAAKLAETTEFLTRRYGKLSGGQRRRADIARALLHTPQVLFLDEPTTGLDPQTRKSIWETIRRIQCENGTTVFLTTHYMEEAENADYVTIIDHGTLAARGTPAQLKEEHTSDTLILYAGEPALLQQKLPVPCRCGTDRAVVKLQNTLEALPLLEQAKGLYTSFEVRTGTMDDVFLNITGKEIREE